MPNPEGINQYTHGGGISPRGEKPAAERLKESVAHLQQSLLRAGAERHGRSIEQEKQHQDANRASREAHGATRGMAIGDSLDKGAHAKAESLHREAATKMRMLGEHEKANEHEANANAHNAAKLATTEFGHRIAAENFEHAGQFRLAGAHSEQADRQHVVIPGLRRFR
jgi:hypothetical protein